MNQNSRRTLCCVLSFLILFSLVTPTAFAEGARRDSPAPGSQEDVFLPEDSSSPENLPPVEDPPSEDNPLPEEEPLPEEDAPSEEGAKPDGQDGGTSGDETSGLPVDDSGSTDNGEGENAESGEEAPAEPSEALLSLQELIAALPAADEIAGMNEEALNRLRERVSQIFDLYDALSEEEQLLADLSPLEDLTAAMNAQSLASQPLSLTVTHSPAAIKCGVPIKFTLTSSGGVGLFKYSVGSIMVRSNSGVYFELDRTKETYTSETNSRTYEFQYTFAASGTYYFDTYVMDMRNGGQVAYVKQRVEFTIDDPAYPSFDDKIEQIYQACMNACPNGSDYDKALFYHDWIIGSAKYDYGYDYAGPSGVLCHGLGTCNSYHEALVLLLTRSGIPCEGSFGNGHIWTRVCLDGVWTLIDSTWDDNDAEDKFLQHMYFGLTDELMQQSHAHTANPQHPCTSLEQNHMIRSGEITVMSDPIKAEIQSLGPGDHTVDAHTGNTVADAYYKTFCPLVAYYLMNKEPALKDSGITVSYNPKEKTYSVNIPCLDSNHQFVSVPAVAPTCTEAGLTEGEKCSVCGAVTVPQETIPATGHTPVTDPAVEPSGFHPGLTEGSHCSVCGKTLTAQKEYLSETILVLPSDGLSGSALWVDGVQLPASAVMEKDGKIYIDLSRTDAKSLVTYTYNKSSSDPHEVYPVGMKVWMLKYSNGYTAENIPQFDNLLKYAGSSIRITGNKGIRMITGIRQNVKRALIGGGIGGYTLREYGTVLAWASEVSASSLVLGAPGAKSNFAYKRGVADPVFASGGGMIQYTNVLVGFNNDQCKADIVMRPYMVLRSADGHDVTLYGGVVQRSIGYIAYQNRSVFTPGSAAYNYVWDIIRHVYGNQFG